MKGQPPWEAHLESVRLEFLQDPPEPQEAGLSHAKHREASPHLPEVGSPTALQGAQYVHLLGDVTHQEIATLHQVVLGGGIREPAHPVMGLEQLIVDLELLLAVVRDHNRGHLVGDDGLGLAVV